MYKGLNVSIFNILMNHNVLQCIRNSSQFCFICTIITLTDLSLIIFHRSLKPYGNRHSLVIRGKGYTQLPLSASCFVPVMSFHPRRLTGSSFVVVIVGGRLQGHNFDLCGNRNLQQLSHLSIICLFTRCILLLLIACKATVVMSID